MITDQPERLLVAEIVREKLFRCTRDEVPHAIAVYVEEMKDRGHNKVYIRVTVYVDGIRRSASSSARTARSSKK